MLSDVSGRGAYTCTCRTGAALGNNLGCLSLIAFGRMKERRDINACLSNAERRDNMRRDLQSLRDPIFGTLRLRNVRARALAYFCSEQYSKARVVHKRRESAETGFLSFSFELLCPLPLCCCSLGDFKYRLSSQSLDDSCCIDAYACEQGYPVQRLYERRKDVIDEVASDAMNLGGKRQVGISSSLSSSAAASASASASSTSSARVHDPLDNDNDNLASMSCRAWWQVTKELEDTSPNANGERGTVHIPAMSEGELYAEYPGLQLSAASTPGASCSSWAPCRVARTPRPLQQRFG
jgi:hypothetical protein